MSRVLVVDDDRAIRELLRVALECEGYAVSTLPDGRGVLEALAGMPEPCVVLMDLSMPWVSGWDVCRALAANPAALAGHQIVLMTAERLPDDAGPAPACAVLRKPFDLDQLFRLVASRFALSDALPDTLPDALPDTLCDVLPDALAAPHDLHTTPTAPRALTAANAASSRQPHCVVHIHGFEPLCSFIGPAHDSYPNHCHFACAVTSR